MKDLRENLQADAKKWEDQYNSLANRVKQFDESYDFWVDQLSIINTQYGGKCPRAFLIPLC